MATASERRAFEQWRELSQFVHRLRHDGEPTASNPALRQVVDADPDGLLAPALLLWLGDNFLLDGRFAEAIAVYQELAERHPDRHFGNETWAGMALEQIASCHEALGQADDAIAALGRALEIPGGSRPAAWLRYQMGRVAETVGRDGEAVNFYRQAADTSDEISRTQASMPDLARRAADRLESDHAWVRPQADALAREVCSALASQDLDSLQRLASPTHFTFGILGSERQFVELRALFDVLQRDLANSSVRANPSALRGSGGKVYLESRGWAGDFFNDRVLFLFSRVRDGFEWSGVAPVRMLPRTEEGPPDIEWPADEPPDLPDDPPGSPELPDSPPVTPASLRMKAPWPVGEHIRGAGSLGSLLSWLRSPQSLRRGVLLRASCLRG